MGYTNKSMQCVDYQHEVIESGRKVKWTENEGNEEDRYYWRCSIPVVGI